MNTQANTPQMPQWQGDFWVEDDDGTQYRFNIYDVNDAVPAGESVYAIVERKDGRYHPHFIGHAESLGEGVSEQQKLERAKRLGANLLFVHEPVPFDAVSCAEAEDRLVKRYQPRLNKFDGNLIAAFFAERSRAFV